MSFASLEYLLFLPVVFLAYWLLCPSLRSKNWLTVCASYFFYGWWDWRFTLLLAFTSAVSFGGGLLEHRWRGRGHRARVVIWACVIVNLGILGSFKYYDFFAESTMRAFESLGFAPPSLPLLHIVLPVGISFYTFQALSYVIDVYKGRLAPARDVVAFFAYLSFFPQLVAGPIERATHLLPQFQHERTFRYATATDGMRQILWGLAKKVVIADGCAEGVNAIFSDYTHLGGTTLLMGALLFSFQIYGDFSGYSDIAIGTGKLFGIELMQNFRTPYFARSIADFWRRWHISLMTWLRDYVYIPLGGNRKGRLRRTLNTFIVFLVSGIWHGAAWTYIVWGLYHALLFIPNTLRKGRKDNTHSSVGSSIGEEWRIAYWVKCFAQAFSTFVLVMVGWILFRSATLTDAAAYLSGIVTRFSLEVPAYGKTMIPLIALMIGAEWLTRMNEHPLQRVVRWRSPLARTILYYALAAAIFYKTGASVQFIYFQF